MNTTKSEALTRVKGGCHLPAGSTLKVWGLLFLTKMSIYNPTPLPPDICDKCIAALSERIGQLEIDRVLKKVTETHYKIERIGLDLQVMYYNRRKEMHNKNARLY